MELLTYLSSLSIPNLFSRMPAAAAQGIIWGIMALGVYITFRLLNVSDLTVDGSFATGGAVTVMLLLRGLPAWAALLLAVAVGILTGLCTGLLHTKFGIPAILAGILTQFALYSINLRIMGKANQTASIKNFGMFWETNGKGFLMSSLYVPQALIAGLLLSAALVALLYWYFGTEQGSAMRATGANPAMSRAQGIHIETMKVIGLGISGCARGRSYDPVPGHGRRVDGQRRNRHRLSCHHHRRGAVRRDFPQGLQLCCPTSFRRLRRRGLLRSHGADSLAQA